MKAKFGFWALSFLAAASLAQPLAHAQQCEPFRDIAVVFINGVDVKPDGYEHNVTRLEQEFGKEYLGADTFWRKVRYPTFHNPSDNAMLDVYETLMQIQQQQPGWQIPFHLLNALYLNETLLPDWLFPARHGFDQTMNAMIARLIVEHSTEITADMTAKMLEMIERKLNILVVSHSQGNLYADALFRSVRQRLQELGRNGQYKMLHVAPPAEINPSQNQYVTNDNDLIINIIRGLGTNAPTGNVSVFLPEQLLAPGIDPAGHGFINLYMLRDLEPYAGNAATKGIRDRLKDAMLDLTRSDSICQTVDSRGTWIQYQLIPPGFPPLLPPTQLNLAAHGIVPGDVIELAANGTWGYDAYWGGTGQSSGAAGIFASDTSYLAKALLGQGGAGTSPEVAPMTNNCTNVTPIDNPHDFLIPDAAWARVKVPAGATRLLLGISDCFQGDNFGTVFVAIRKVGNED